MSRTDKAMSLVNRYGKTALRNLVAARAQKTNDSDFNKPADYAKFAIELERLISVATSPMPDRIIVRKTYENVEPCRQMLVSVSAQSANGRNCESRHMLDADEPDALTIGLNDALNKNHMCLQLLAATPYLWDKDGVRAPVNTLPKFALLDYRDLVDLLGDKDAVNMCEWDVQENEDPTVVFDLIKITRERRRAK